MMTKAKPVRDTMLYEICSLCNGTGIRSPDHKGFTRACYCKPLRVVAVGITSGQLERLVEASPEGQRIREVASLNFAPRRKPTKGGES